ncbi:MAG TPA: Maf family protein [Bacteroidota bacterium]|nr:Maf family protein [Bacteroidota bacterium]
MQFFKPIVLASQSPRRIALLKQVGLHPDVIPSRISEEFDPLMTAVENTKRLALEKALEVGRGLENALVVGADTTVVLADQVLAKPTDPEDAIRMLELLSGRTHVVHTGFALLDRPSDRYVVDVESTIVTFRNLPRSEIEDYVATGSPMDKAGAYGIQDDYGAVFVSRIEGCFYNVVGFPLSKFYTRLAEFQSQLSSDKG